LEQIEDVDDDDDDLLSRKSSPTKFKSNFNDLEKGGHKLNKSIFG